MILLAEYSGDKCQGPAWWLVIYQPGDTWPVCPVSSPADAVSGALSRRIHIRHMEHGSSKCFACRGNSPISLASRSGTSLDNIPCSLHHRHVCRTICATADWVMQTQTLHVCKTFFTPRPLLLFSPTSYLSRIQEEAHNCSLAMLRDCCPVAILGPGQYIVWESHFCQKISQNVYF